MLQRPDPPSVPHTHAHGPASLSQTAEPECASRIHPTAAPGSELDHALLSLQEVEGASSAASIPLWLMLPLMPAERGSPSRRVWPGTCRVLGISLNSQEADPVPLIKVAPLAGLFSPQPLLCPTAPLSSQKVSSLPLRSLLNMAPFIQRGLGMGLGLPRG